MNNTIYHILLTSIKIHRDEIVSQTTDKARPRRTEEKKYQIRTNDCMHTSSFACGTRREKKNAKMKWNEIPLNFKVIIMEIRSFVLWHPMPVSQQRLNGKKSRRTAKIGKLNQTVPIIEPYERERAIKNWCFRFVRFLYVRRVISRLSLHLYTSIEKQRRQRESERTEIERKNHLLVHASCVSTVLCDANKYVNWSLIAAAIT